MEAYEYFKGRVPGKPSYYTTLDYMYAFYSENSGLSPKEKFSMNDHMRAFWIKENGPAGNLSNTELERRYYVSLGIDATNLRAARQDWYDKPIGEPADTTAPSVPTNFAVVPGDRQASLSWTASTDNVNVAGYRVFRDGVEVATTLNTSRIVGSLTNGVAYTFTVQAYDPSGNNSAQTAGIQVTPTAPADVIAPTTPTNVQGSPSNTSISLTWTPSTDAVGVVGYEVEENAESVAVVDTAAYVSSGLVSGTQYTYRVRAFDDAGNNSAWSNPTTITTTIPADVAPPTVPTNLVAQALDASVQLSWDASTDAIGVQGYRVLRNPGSVVVTAGATQITITGLTNNTAYTFQVQAYDAAGNNSAYSATVSATPVAPSVAQFIEPAWELNYGDPNTPVAAYATATGSGVTAGYEVLHQVQKKEIPTAAGVSKPERLLIVRGADIPGGLLRNAFRADQRVGERYGTALRAEIHDFLPSDAANVPAENWELAPNEEHWFEMKYLLGPEFDFAPQAGAPWLTPTQWKGWGTGSPPMSVEIDGENLLFGGAPESLTGIYRPWADHGQKPARTLVTGLQRSRVYRVTAGFFLSTDPTKGWIEVYVDGVLKIARTYGPTQDLDPTTGLPRGVYFKWGIYRSSGWESLTNDQGGTGINHVIYTGEPRYSHSKTTFINPVKPSDTFDRANTTGGLGNSNTGFLWKNSDQFIIDGNCMRPANVTSNRFTYIDNKWPVGQVEATLDAIDAAAANAGGGLGIRIGRDGTTVSGFYLSTRTGTVDKGLRFYPATTAAVGSPVGTFTATPIVAGDTLKIVDTGTELIGYLNNVERARATVGAANIDATGVGFLGHTAGKLTKWRNITAS